MKLLHWKTALTFAILAAPVVFTPLAAQQDTSAGVAVPDTTVSPGAPADSDSTLVPDSSAGATAGDSVAQAPDSTAPAAAADTVKKAKKKIRPPGEEIEAAVIGWDWDDYTIMTEAGLRRPDGREFSLAKNEFYDSCFSMAGKDVLVYGHPARDREGFYNFTLTAFPEEIAALAKDELEIKSKPPKPKLPRYINKNRVKGNTGIGIFIDPEGKVNRRRTTVIRSCGYRALDELALEWAGKIEFAAPKKNGRPVYARLTWPVVWVTGIREKGQEQEQERILELAGDWEPTAIVWVPTVYPESARLSGLEGTTVLVIRITGQGDVDSAIVAQGSGDDSLDAAALRAALETEFSPRREKGQPVSRWAKYPVIFRLPPAGSPQDESSWPEADSVYLASANKMPGIRYMPPRPAGVGNSGGYPVTVIAFFVDQRGYVDPYRTAIAASSGYPELDSTALEWAWKCRFYPASNMGEPVAVKMTVPVKWTGDGSDERAYSPPSVPPVKTPAREEVTGQPPPTEAEQEQPPVPEQASVEEASEEKDRERASMPETMPELEGRPPLPKMPPDIARARVDGTTRVAFLVGADGSVVPDQVEILQSSGYPELDSLAAGWVRQLKFKPATGGGEPVAARISMPVHWKSGR